MKRLEKHAADGVNERVDLADFRFDPFDERAEGLVVEHVAGICDSPGFPGNRHETLDVPRDENRRSTAGRDPARHLGADAPGAPGNQHDFTHRRLDAAANDRANKRLCSRGMRLSRAIVPAALGTPYRSEARPRHSSQRGPQCRNEGMRRNWGGYARAERLPSLARLNAGKGRWSPLPSGTPIIAVRPQRSFRRGPQHRNLGMCRICAGSRSIRVGVPRSCVGVRRICVGMRRICARLCSIRVSVRRICVGVRRIRVGVRRICVDVRRIASACVALRRRASHLRRRASHSRKCASHLRRRASHPRRRAPHPRRREPHPRRREPHRRRLAPARSERSR